MPLLRNEKFVPIECEGLSPDQDVFYLSLTKEVFTNYDDFFERSILCNSMVWGCSVTGKTGLTFYDALKSEQKALRNLEVLPASFHVPILVLAGLSKCSRIKELAGHVYTFLRNRYFIGEKVRISCEGIKTSGVVVDIKCPAVQAYQKLDKFAPVPFPAAEELFYVVKASPVRSKSRKGTTSSTASNSCNTTASPKKEKDRTVMFNMHALSRANNKTAAVQVTADTAIFSRLKLSQFIKTCCKIANKQVVVKKEFFERYSLLKFSFEDFFGASPLPDFAVAPEVVESRNEIVAKVNLFSNSKSKKAEAFGLNWTPMKHLNTLFLQTDSSSSNDPPNKKKGKKRNHDEKGGANAATDSNAAAAAAHDSSCNNNNNNNASNTLNGAVPKPKKTEIDRKLEEAKRQQEAEQKRLRAEWLKKWSRVRDDLELEDHRELSPLPTGVCAQLGTNSYCGTALLPGIVAIVEFVNTFQDILRVKQFVPGNKITFSYIMESLHDSNVFGKFYPVLACLLTNVLSCLDQTTNYDLTVDEQTEILTEISNWDFLSSENQNILLKASDTVFYCLSHLGLPLTRLPINPYTVSEVLRLHLSASGFKSLIEISKMKSQKSNTVSLLENPSVDFRFTHQRILHRLQYQSVYRLNLEEKVKLLNCLCDELAAINSDLRELILNSSELMQEAKSDLKKFQKVEAKRKKDISMARCWRSQRLNGDLLKMGEITDTNDVLFVLQNLSKMDEVTLKQHKQALLDVILTLDHTEYEQKQQPGGEASIIDNLDQKQIVEIEALFPFPTDEDVQNDETVLGAVLDPSQLTKFVGNLKLIREEVEKRANEQERRFMDKLSAHQSAWGWGPLGQDRAHRRYWKFYTIPGIFVEEDVEFRKWAEVNGPKGHFTPPCFEENPNWDIEEMAEHGFNGAPMHPKWPPLELVPSGRSYKTTWSFYSTVESIDSLLACLNSRGLRESALKETLNALKPSILFDLQFSENQDIFDMLTEYDPNDMLNQCSNLDLVEIFCKSCKLFFDRLSNGPFLNSSLTLHDRQQMLSQINRGFIRDVNASLTGATSIQSYAEVLTKLTSAIRKDYLGAPLVSTHNEDTYLSQDHSMDQNGSDGDEKGHGLGGGAATSPSRADSGSPSSNTVNYKVETAPFIQRWMESLQSSSGFAQLFLFLHILNLSIKWNKSSSSIGGGASCGCGAKKICNSCLIPSSLSHQSSSTLSVNDSLHTCKICNRPYHRSAFCFGLRHHTICSSCYRYQSKLSNRNLSKSTSNTATAAVGTHSSASSPAAAAAANGQQMDSIHSNSSDSPHQHHHHPNGGTTSLNKTHHRNYHMLNSKHKAGLNGIHHTNCGVDKKAAIEEKQEVEEEVEKLDKFAILPVLDDGVYCELCGLGGFVLCCDKCPKMFHLKCASPQLKDVPIDDWYCQVCSGRVSQTEFEMLKRSRKRNKLADMSMKCDEVVS